MRRSANLLPQLFESWRLNVVEWFSCQVINSLPNTPFIRPSQSINTLNMPRIRPLYCDVCDHYGLLMSFDTEWADKKILLIIIKVFFWIPLRNISYIWSTSRLLSIIRLKTAVFHSDKLFINTPRASSHQKLILFYIFY